MEDHRLAHQTSESGPRLTGWTTRQVGSYLGYTGRAANVAATAAPDPERTSPASTRVASDLASRSIARTGGSRTITLEDAISLHRFAI
jgi:hypothetical protein